MDTETESSMAYQTPYTMWASAEINEMHIT